MPSVFLCYRREDSAPYAGWLRSVLVEAFGKTRVFMDIDAIRPGEDFDDKIRETLDRSDVVLAMIGPRWLDIRSEDGTRRLDNPDDYVRLEITSALERQIVVIPVLMGGSQVPKSTDLPEGIMKLSRHHAAALRDDRWSYDTQRLIETIESYAAERIRTARRVAPIPRPQPAP